MVGLVFFVLELLESTRFLMFFFSRNCLILFFCVPNFQITKLESGFGFLLSFEFLTIPVFLVRGSKKIHTRCFLGPNRKRVELDVVHDFL